MADWIVRLVGVLLLLTALAIPLSRAPDRDVQTLVGRWAPAPSDFIDLDGQLVHLRDEGPRNDPAPLLLLHGTASSLHTWEGWVRALRGTRRVITLDLPGFGLTGPSRAADYRGDTYARFVLALMDHLKLTRVVLGGNSLGGEIAWRVASLAPQRVQRLILVDATGYAYRPLSVPLAFRIARVPGLNRLSEHLLPRGVVEDSVRDVYGDPARVSSTLVDRHFELALREGNRRALSQRFEALATDQANGADNLARLRALKLPTLVVWGGRDRLVPPDDARRFAADIAGSRLVLFDGLGHVPQEEDPVATVAAVMAFLAEP